MTIAPTGTAYPLPLGRDRSSPPRGSGERCPRLFSVFQFFETSVGLDLTCPEKQQGTFLMAGSATLREWDRARRDGPMDDFIPSPRVSHHEA